MAPQKVIGSPLGRNRPNSVSFRAAAFAARTATAQTSRRFLWPTKKDSFVQLRARQGLGMSLRFYPRGSSGSSVGSILVPTPTRRRIKKMLSKGLPTRVAQSIPSRFAILAGYSLRQPCQINHLDGYLRKRIRRFGGH